MLENELKNFNKVLSGGNLPYQSLPELLKSEKIIILHFLRHLGCIYCQYTVDQLYKLKQDNPKFPTVIFVHQNEIQEADFFFAKHFPKAIHISDTTFELYNLFKINRLKGFQLINPKMFLKGLKLTLIGYWNRFLGKDIMLLSGTFLFYNGNLIWYHRAKYAGDEPNWKKIQEVKT